MTFTVQVTNPPLLSGNNFIAFKGYFNGDQYVDVGLWDTLTGTWYIADRDPGSNSFIPRSTPVLQNWGGGPYANCGIVYDALGGARKAYTVHNGFWSNAQGTGW